jgi:hypothetical protein
MPVAFAPAPPPLKLQPSPVPQLFPQQACPLAPQASHMPLAQRLPEAVQDMLENPPPPGAPAPPAPPAPLAPQQLCPTAPQAVPLASWHDPLVHIPVMLLPPPVQADPFARQVFRTQQPPPLQLFAAQQGCPSPPQVGPLAPPGPPFAPPVAVLEWPPFPETEVPPVPGADEPPLPDVEGAPPVPDELGLLLLEHAASAISSAARCQAGRGSLETSRPVDRWGKRRLMADLQVELLMGSGASHEHRRSVGGGGH